VTELGFGAAATGAALWAGRKALGPVLDEIGDDLRSRYSERRSRNAERVLTIGHAKLGPAVEEEGSVAPRAALRIIEEGSWCDAEVMAEYFGGILAASRSKGGTDDRGATWASLVSRLSTYDVYLHYLAYDAFRRLYVGRDDLKLGESTTRESCKVYLPGGDTLEAMGLQPTWEDWSQTCSPSTSALIREGLIGPYYAFGGKEQLSESAHIDAPDAGLVFMPSLPGIELFFWAHGHGSRPASMILDRSLSFEPQMELGQVDAARIVRDMRSEKAERRRREQQEMDQGTGEPQPSG
jgi:hypothetical protein